MVTLTGTHHTTHLVNCPPLIEKMILSQWKPGDTGINFRTIQRWVTPGVFTQPKKVTERWSKFQGIGAYAYSSSEGTLEW